MCEPLASGPARSTSRSVLTHHRTDPVPGVLGEPPAGEANDSRAGSVRVADPVAGPVVLDKRWQLRQAYSEVTFSLVANFFLTTFPTNMRPCCNSNRSHRPFTCCPLWACTARTLRLKFPVFEIINRAMMFTDLSPGVSAVPGGCSDRACDGSVGFSGGLISGWLFCTIMLPVSSLDPKPNSPQLFQSRLGAADR